MSGIYPQRIKALRKRLGLTQAEFGQLLGTHGVTVSHWESENGRASPSPYQEAMLKQFEVAAEKKAWGSTLRTMLVGAGIVAVIYLLLKIAQEGK